ncbi:MAG: sigma-70 family RNA polymerase sigma factor [Candidatus Daviesbacteria bacterium]|nr:sigma-70 family RNA polymerase sigma factor [Candidatus Daviesbacteria bacterium]
MTNPESESLEELTALSLLASETEEHQGSIIGLRIGPYNAALYRRRQALGLTKKQLAAKVGFKTGASIGQIETLRAFPSPEIAKSIADALSITPKELFPEWLKLFTRDKKQPAQIRMELTESEVDPILMRRAYEIETIFTAVDPQNEAESQELREKLYDVLGGMTQRERRVIISRFGLEGKALTLEEVAAEFRLGRERIRTIEAKTLRKLRHSFRKKKLEGLEDQQPGDLRSPQALINGAVNALHQGDRERAIKNLDEVLENYLFDFMIPTGVIDQLKALLKEPGFYRWTDRQMNTFIGCLEVDPALESLYPELEKRVFEEIIPNLCEVEKLKIKAHKH